MANILVREHLLCKLVRHQHDWWPTLYELLTTDALARLAAQARPVVPATKNR
jgi:hypothetical protein